MSGDIEPLNRVSTHASPVTIFPPPGVMVIGADEVDRFNAEGAAQFGPGSENSFETVHASSSGDLAYWVGAQRSVANVIGAEEPVPMDLRVTEIFRREGGEWKLIHRHVDRLVE